MVLSFLPRGSPMISLWFYGSSSEFLGNPYFLFHGPLWVGSPSWQPMFLGPGLLGGFWLQLAWLWLAFGWPAFKLSAGFLDLAGLASA